MRSNYVCRSLFLCLLSVSVRLSDCAFVYTVYVWEQERKERKREIKTSVGSFDDGKRDARCDAMQCETRPSVRLSVCPSVRSASFMSLPCPRDRPTHSRTHTVECKWQKRRRIAKLGIFLYGLSNWRNELSWVKGGGRYAVGVRDLASYTILLEMCLTRVGSTVVALLFLGFTFQPSLITMAPFHALLEYSERTNTRMQANMLKDCATSS